MVDTARRHGVRTPIRPWVLEDKLVGIGYDPSLIEYLVDGFSNGFDVLAQGATAAAQVLPGDPPLFRPYCPNLPSATASPEAEALLLTYVVGESRALRFFGPFDGPPEGKHWQEAWASPLGAVPKQDKLRLIFHLSDGGRRSVNERISRADGKVNYVTFEEVLYTIVKAGPGAHLAATDVSNAFRNMPLRARDLKLMILSLKGKWFIEACLPFGVRTGPHIYDTFGQAFNAIVLQDPQVRNAGVSIPRMLDDHLVVGPSLETTDVALDRLLEIATEIGVPISLPKTVRACLALKWIGFWWDVKNDRVSVDAVRWERLGTRLRALLDGFASLQPSPLALSINGQELRSLVGLLGWASKVIPFSRVFINALHANLTASGLNSVTRAVAVRQTVVLDALALEDLQFWLGCCYAPGGPPGCRMSTWVYPLPPSRVAHTDACEVGLSVWTDSLQWAFMEVPAWLTLSFEKPPTLDWVGGADPERISSGHAELAAILFALLLFCMDWSCQTVRIYTDSSNAVDAWASLSSSSGSVAQYLRAIARVCMEFGITLQLRHIPGVENGIADAISRAQVARFKALHALLASRPPCSPLPSVGSVFLPTQ